MAGTLVWYQGFLASACSFRRSTGFAPDGTVLEIPAVQFPAPFDVEAPGPPGAPGEVADDAGTALDDAQKKALLPKLGALQEALARTQVGTPDPPTADVLGVGGQGFDLASQSAEAALKFVGDLVFAESVPADPTDPGGVTKWTLTVPNLFVVSVDKQRPREPTGKVSVSLTDIRAFWDAGAILVYAWNQVDKDGNAIPDTVKEDGELYTLREIVEEIVKYLPGAQGVEAVPESWDELTPELKFPALYRARDALVEIVSQFQVRFALHFDNSVGFYTPGEGPVGETLTGPDIGGGNELPFSARDVQDAGGSGEQAGRELRYPFDHVIVVGGERIASVAIDCWRPVLMIEDEVMPIEAGVAELLHPPTDLANKLVEREAQFQAIREARQAGRAPAQEVLDGLQTLTDEVRALRRQALLDGTLKATDEDMLFVRRLVLRPDMLRSSPELTPYAREVLEKDAYKLWQLPGIKGYNKHLPPILKRAETSDGIDLPVQVETFRWTMLETKLSVSAFGDRILPEGQLLSEQRRAVARLQEQVADIRRAFELKISAGLGFGGEVSVDEEVQAELQGNTFGFASVAQIQDVSIAIDRIVRDVHGDFGAGLAEVIREVQADAGLTAAHTAAGLVRLSETQRAASNGLALLWPALRARAAQDQGTTFDQDANAYEARLLQLSEARAGLDDLTEPETDAFDIQLAQKLIEIGEAKRADLSTVGLIAQAVQILRQRITAILDFQAEQSGTRTGREETFPLVRHPVNLDREVDPTARLVDADLGLIRTVEPAGHLDRTAVLSLDGRTLVPRAVRVTFGTHVSPKRSGARPRPTGPDPLCGPDDQGRFTLKPQNIIPQALLDAEARDDLNERVYYQAFQRKVSGYRNVFADDGVTVLAQIPIVEALPIKLSQVPEGGALPIQRSDLIERIRLNNDTNRSQLDDTARALAAAAFARATGYTGQRLLFLRPRRVNPNGLISGVEVSTRAGAVGIQTLVVLGREDEPFTQDNKTRVRKAPSPNKGAPDGAESRGFGVTSLS